MRTEYGSDAAIFVLPSTDELQPFSNGVAGVLGVGTSLIDDRCGNQRAHATSLDDVGDDVRKVVHVDERCRTAADHLPAGELSADTNKLRVYELDLRWKNVVVEPFHQCHIVGDAAQQRHCRM